MLSSLCFLGVNLTLTVILSNIMWNKQKVDGLFLIALMFTAVGNILLTYSVTTSIILINAFLSIFNLGYALKINRN